MLATIAVVGAATGCADLPAPETPSLPPSQTLWMIEASPKGITMAVGQEQQLTVTARNILGEVMTIPDSAPVQFISDDPTLVNVTDAGVVQALGATGSSPSQVRVRWQYGEVTKVDTLYVAITSTVPAEPVASISIQPAAYPADSTWVSVYTQSFLVPRGQQVTVTARTASNVIVPDVYAYRYSSNRREQKREIVSPSGVFGDALTIPAGESIWVYAEATVYGVPLRDSVQYLVTDGVVGGYQIHTDVATGEVKAENYFRPTGQTAAQITVASCAVVAFVNESSIPVKILFDNPSATTTCPSGAMFGAAPGDILLLDAGGFAARQWSASGEYGWTMTHANGGPLSPFNPNIRSSVRVRSHTDF